MPTSPDLCSSCSVHCEFLQNTAALSNAGASHDDEQAVISGLFQPKRTAQDLAALEQVRKQIAQAYATEIRDAKERGCPHVS